MKIEETIEERRMRLKIGLKKYQGKSYWCPALNSLVLVNSKSVKETANWAAKTPNGEKMAMRLPEVIRKAIVFELYLEPKENKQKNKFHFITLATLISDMGKLGIAKLTVGYRKNGDVIEYCITEVK